MREVLYGELLAVLETEEDKMDALSEVDKLISELNVSLERADNLQGEIEPRLDELLNAIRVMTASALSGCEDLRRELDG